MYARSELCAPPYGQSDNVAKPSSSPRSSPAPATYGFGVYLEEVAGHNAMSGPGAPWSSSRLGQFHESQEARHDPDHAYSQGRERILTHRPEKKPQAGAQVPFGNECQAEFAVLMRLCPTKKPLRQFRMARTHVFEHSGM